MIEVEVVQDIRKHKSKIFGPLGLREFICIGIGAAYSIPIALAIPADVLTKVAVGIFLAFPAVLCGFIKVNKEPFEIVIIRFIYKRILTPRKRKVKRIPEYKADLIAMRKKEEQEKVSKMSKRKKKEYQKGIITYSKDPENKMYR